MSSPLIFLKVVLEPGLEPGTTCLEGRCSIQLSYSSNQTVAANCWLPPTGESMRNGFGDCLTVEQPTNSVTRLTKKAIRFIG